MSLQQKFYCESRYSDKKPKNVPEILRFTFCRFRKRKCKPQYFRNGGLNQNSLHQIPRTLSKKHTGQVSDHSSEPVLQEVVQKLKKQSRDKAV